MYGIDVKRFTIRLSTDMRAEITSFVPKGGKTDNQKI